MNTHRFLVDPKRVAAGFALLLLVASCQSPPPPVEQPAAEAVPAVVVEPTAEVEPVVIDPALVIDPAAETPAVPNRVEIARDGFSPLAQSPANEVFLDFRWGEASLVKTWELRIGDVSGTVFRTLAGQDSAPGATWNGRDDAGALVPQGAYQALLLATDVNGRLSESAPSSSFWVDIIPPSGTVTVSPSLFRLVDPHVIVSPEREVTITLEIVSGGSGWATWRLGVLHPDGRLFRDFISEDYRDNSIVWDGRAVNNAQLEGGSTYQLAVEVFSRYGNKGRLFGGLAVAVPEQKPVAPEPVTSVAQVAVIPFVPEPEPRPLEVSVTLDGQQLAALPVWFAPNTADLEAVDAELGTLNHSSLTQLAYLLSQVPGTDVTVVGHANQVLYFDAEKAAYEQSETLLPLSLSRAEAVRESLISLGLDGEGLMTEGVGALEPLAPFDDAALRWKNRRVVIELVTR